MLFRQSILSQFSHKTKATEDTTEEAEDDVALNELDDGEQEMEDEVDGIDEEDVEDVEDEVDPSVEESDAAVVEAVAADVGDEGEVPTLTRAEVNLGKFAVTKVSITLLV